MTSNSLEEKSELSNGADTASIIINGADDTLASPPPDGGLHAWLVCAGVSSLFCKTCVDVFYLRMQAFSAILASGGMSVAWGVRAHLERLGTSF